MIVHATWKEEIWFILRCLMWWCGNWRKWGMYLNWKKTLISICALEALGFEVSIRDGILKMTRGSMVVLKGIWRNNLYYLKGSTVIWLVTSTNSDDNCNFYKFRWWLHPTLTYEARTYIKKVFVSSCNAKFIERCQNLQIRFL